MLWIFGTRSCLIGLCCMTQHTRWDQEEKFLCIIVKVRSCFGPLGFPSWTLRSCCLQLLGSLYARPHPCLQLYGVLLVCTLTMCCFRLDLVTKPFGHSSQWYFFSSWYWAMCNRSIRRFLSIFIQNWQMNVSSLCTARMCIFRLRVLLKTLSHLSHLISLSSWSSMCSFRLLEFAKRFPQSSQNTVLSFCGAWILGAFMPWALAPCSCKA